MKKITSIALWLALMIVVGISSVLAADPVKTAVDWIPLVIGILTLPIVYAATWVVRSYFPLISGVLTVTVVVPALTAILTVISNVVGSGGLSPLLQGALGLLAVFVSQVQIQIEKSKDATTLTTKTTVATEVPVHH